MSKTHGHARKRTVHVYELCKGKKICEGGDEIDEKLDNGGESEVKKVSTGVQHAFGWSHVIQRKQGHIIGCMGYLICIVESAGL